jgi:methionine-rich copper-binding protein CopC
MKTNLWLLVCIFLLASVSAVWVHRVLQQLHPSQQEGLIASSNSVTQPNARASNNNSKHVGSIESILDDLENTLNPIYRQVSQQNQILRVVVDKEPKPGFTSPDMKFQFDNPTDIMPTLHITLCKGVEGPVGTVGKTGPTGPEGPTGPRGPPGK